MAMLAFIILVGLTLLLVGAAGIVSFVGDHQKGRITPQSAWGGVIGWIAMLCLFVWLVANLYNDPTLSGDGLS